MSSSTSSRTTGTISTRRSLKDCRSPAASSSMRPSRLQMKMSSRWASLVRISAISASSIWSTWSSPTPSATASLMSLAAPTRIFAWGPTWLSASESTKKPTPGWETASLATSSSR